MASQPDGSPVTPTPRHRLTGVERPFALHPPAMSFGAGSSHHYRFSDFDEGMFSEHAEVSADQAKRALRAHLAETERRMAEAGRLGTALVQQQKDLTDRLREVEELQSESDLAPELKKKLAELEKEYDDVARETARAFLPKQRIPSNESTGSPEGKGGRRSLSPVKYESHASGSPSKLTVSTRKQRNQPTNRVHDIEFAAEISTSLISQVRGLQALLAEREEELRDTKQDQARLEDEGEGLRERIKELDESEHRYKEENWNLETRIHEFEAAQRDAADNEKKVAQQLATLLADKTKSQRELDELKASHSRLVDDHTAAVKLHDIELGTAKRNMAMADSEKAALQRRIDELAGQNQELARAVSMQHRTRAVESDAVPATSDDEFDTAADNITPEHSPPASPVKGTPRHSVLESETLKTSLLHAQRTLQSLRTNLHREKTEKLELRRMLQDTRDELERARSDPNGSGSGASKKNRKDPIHNKLRSSQLGGARSSRTDLYMLASNDPDWEEVQGDASPSAAKARAGPTDISDQFDTANEAQLSDTSFATANDGAGTAEDFHTGAEAVSSGEDTMTETEQDASRRRTLVAKSGSATAADASVDLENDPANQSTASTSDDDDFDSPRTPTASLSAAGVSRMRLRASRSSLASRRLRHMSSVDEVGSSPVGMQGSPYSAAGSPATMAHTPGSINSTPRVAGPQQSLFAELGDLGEDSDEEVASDGTPSRVRSPRIIIPSGFGGSVKSTSSSNSIAHSPLTQIGQSPKIVMVDRSTLTDAVTILPWSEADEKQAQTGLDRTPESRPSSFMSEGAVNVGEKLKEFPSPPTSPPGRGNLLTPVVLPPPNAEPTSRSIEAGPDSEPEVKFNLSEVFSVLIDPVATPIVPADFTVSDVSLMSIEPVAEPESPKPSPIILGMSSVSVEHVTPKMPTTPEPEPVPAFTTSLLHAVNVTPIELPAPVVPVPVPVVLPKEAPPTFTVSAIEKQHVPPVAEPEPVIVPLDPLSFSGFHAQNVAPVSEPEPVLPPIEPFTFTALQTLHVEPVQEPEIPLPPLPQFSVSDIQRQHVEPIATPQKPMPTMVVSNVLSQHVPPFVVEEPEEEVIPVPVGVSTATQTDEWKPEVPVASAGVIGAGAALLGGAAAAAAGLNDDSVPRSPKRNGFILPRDFDPILAQDENARPRGRPTTPNRENTSALFGWSKAKGPSTPIIAEDETRQSPNASPLAETPESQRPFKEISANASAPRHGDHSQGHADDQDFMPSPSSTQSVIRDEAFETTPRTTVRGFKSIPPPEHTRTASQDSNTGSVRRGMHSDAIRNEIAAAAFVSSRRPGSSSSNRRTSNDFALPPLPANHREVIEAARTGSAGSMAGEMAGPSNWRVRTPTGSAREPAFATQGGATPTPRANSRTAVIGDMRPPSRPASRTNASQTGASGVHNTISRQTSMSSFASEVDARFHIHDGTDVFGTGYGHTDPRMIQAITQTMIGEYLWKYTRKTGRSGLSENRHRRYFWIHPYTRMLSWSDHGPTPGSRSEQRAKSIPIEGVRVVTDDNPMPPGLHRKSLIVISPGRTVKFTCPTSHRHEIWFNALSYLLLRNDEVPNDGMTANGEPITREDVDEFNPPFAGNRLSAAPQARRRPPVSLASYNSRTTRNESPALDMSMNIPTLTPTPNKKASAAAGSMTPSTSVAGLTSRSRLSRIGGYWRSSQSLSAQFNSFRGRSTTPLGHRHTNSGAQGSGIYEASDMNDSAEELRAMYEAQDRASDRLENVRACCDGKHDVGMLSHSSRRHRHSNGTSSVMSTPTHSTRHRS
ncbi:nuclear migration protein [Sporothrix schenckii 1099-18]|uniref:PH domain-containing protein n=2 Tax=Sporothrix schenckii TaxID=29908 RepID=U7PTY6_SPOS1|nr:nuclear migration protein [Sporothrix schenckii 1099-18]ERS98229.1 hypothetical protein HMPREF1624_05012 [Sporothrix schenckii ATCC 58251]KJR89667.1 nuclear migration protein [Sporothrix schenckii 1099-18]